MTRNPRRTKLVEKAAIPRSPATNCSAASLEVVGFRVGLRVSNRRFFSRPEWPSARPAAFFLHLSEGLCHYREMNVDPSTVLYSNEPEYENFYSPEPQHRKGLSSMSQDSRRRHPAPPGDSLLPSCQRRAADSHRNGLANLFLLCYESRSYVASSCDYNPADGSCTEVDKRIVQFCCASPDSLVRPTRS